MSSCELSRELKLQQKTCLAIEIRKDQKMGRAYGTVIDDYSSVELKKIFDKHISKQKLRCEQISGQDICPFTIEIYDGKNKIR